MVSAIFHCSERTINLKRQFLCSNGSWRSVWNIDFQDESQMLDIKGKLQVTFATQLSLCKLDVTYSFFFCHWMWLIQSQRNINKRFLKNSIISFSSGRSPLFRRRKCWVRCKEGIPRFDNISGIPHTIISQEVNASMYYTMCNVPLDTKLAVEFLFTFFQSADDCAIAIANIIRHHETEYLAALEVSKFATHYF